MGRTAAPANERAERVRQNLGLMMRLLGASDRELGERLTPAMGRRSVQKRRAGPVPIRAGELDAFAEALGVPLYLFLEEPGEIYRYFGKQDDGSTQDSHSPTWRMASEMPVASMAAA